MKVPFPFDAQGVSPAMEVTLLQYGKSCLLEMRIDGYAGMAELSAPLAAGMPTIFSYWSSDQMFWMDGEGLDQRGLHAADNAAETARSGSVKFCDFSI